MLKSLCVLGLMCLSSISFAQISGVVSAGKGKNQTR